MERMAIVARGLVIFGRGVWVSRYGEDGMVWYVVLRYCDDGVGLHMVGRFNADWLVECGGLENMVASRVSRTLDFKNQSEAIDFMLCILREHIIRLRSRLPYKVF
jgi:hypothetical protein